MALPVFHSHLVPGTAQQQPQEEMKHSGAFPPGFGVLTVSFLKSSVSPEQGWMDLLNRRANYGAEFIGLYPRACRRGRKETHGNWRCECED